MTDSNPGTESTPDENAATPPEANIETGRRFSIIWLIPLIAIGIAMYLGWTTLSEKGPEITIRLHTADGLEVGKTLIKYKAVVFGTVQNIELSPDGRDVIVTAAMTKQAEPLLRKGSQFWVVSPRISASGGLTGLSTIVSGVYIEFEPGRGKNYSDEFIGLDSPPVIQSDVPGTEFILKTDKLGSIGAGSPIFHRDVQVGQILGVDSNHLVTGITIRAFVRAPFDKEVEAGTTFWNASGIVLGTGPQGFKLQLESLQAVLAGGVAFDTPAADVSNTPAPPGTSFTLYSDQNAADEAQYTEQLPYLIYFDGSVSGLGPGSSVEWHGLKIGRVTASRLEYDVALGRLRAPVTVVIEPERIKFVGGDAKFDKKDMIAKLVRNGLRAQVKTTNYLTGQSVISLDIDPKAPPTELGQGDILPIIPSAPGQFDAILGSASDILASIKALPLDKVVNQANDTLKSFQDVANAPEIKESLRTLTAALTSARELVDQAKVDLQPALRKLPPLLDAAQDSMGRINSTLGSFDRGYGGTSTFKRDLARLMSQVNDAVRSIRVLSDYLEQHPESLIRGKN